ncbi:MAG: class I SAM-dependent methyltransferase [Chlamydiota bacterium]
MENAPAGEMRGPNTQSAQDVIKFPPLMHREGSIGYIEKMVIGAFLVISRPRLVIETGTFNGDTTRFIADYIALNQLPVCRIVTFDMPEILQALRKSDPYFSNHQEIEFIPGLLPRSLELFLSSVDQPVDFAIIDATHAYLPVMQELLLIHPLLKKEGYIYCHDYREHDPDYEGTVCAVDRFAASHHYGKIALNSVGTVWGSALLRKPSQRYSTLRHAYYSYALRTFPFLRRLHPKGLRETPSRAG